MVLEGLRERKRRETRKRIAETGLGLFLEHGYEATTLDAIAAAADISRRTFFHYFESKEDILVAWESGAGEAFRDALDERPADEPPLEAMRNAMLTAITRFGTERALAIHRLMQETEALRARKQANYERHEQAWLTALREKWPDPARQAALRVVAVTGVGAFRIACERWSADGGKRPLGDYVEETFDTLKGELGP